MIVTDTIRKRAAILRNLSNVEIEAKLKDPAEFSIFCKMLRTVAGTIAEVPEGEDPALVPVEASVDVPVNKVSTRKK
jgi:hypothetical protein